MAAWSHFSCLPKEKAQSLRVPSYARGCRFPEFSLERADYRPDGYSDQRPQQQNHTEDEKSALRIVLTIEQQKTPMEEHQSTLIEMTQLAGAVVRHPGIGTIIDQTSGLLQAVAPISLFKIHEESLIQLSDLLKGCGGDHQARAL